MKWMNVLFPVGTVRRGVSLAFLTFEQMIQEKGFPGLIKFFIGLVVFWHIYVPVHELLHVAGCFLAGGEVTSLALKPRYGGWVLQKIFPFVVPESEYAGRLTGFAAPGAWRYAFVDFLPYSLSLFGMTLLAACGRMKSAFLLGPAFILVFVPFMSIPGDYYEAVSLVTTKLATALNPGLGAKALVSDDVFRSVQGLRNQGNLNGSVGFLIFAGVMGAVYLAFMTLALQVKISDVIHRSNDGKMK